MTWLPQTVASREIKSWQNTRQFGYASVRNLIVRIGIIMYNWHMVCYHVYIRCRCTLLNTRSYSCALSVDLLQRFWVPQVSKSEKKIHIIWGHIIAYCHTYFTKHTNGFMFHAACRVPLHNSASHCKTSDIFDNLPDSLVANRSKQLSQGVDNTSTSE